MLQPVIFAVAARSGGHVLPCITRAQQLAQQEQARIILITTNSPLDHHLAAKYAPEAISLELGNVGRSPFSVLKFLWQLLKSFFTCLKIFKKHKVKCVVSTGGFCAIPAMSAAWLLNIQRELWELNVEPGKAIKLLQFIAQPVHICFAKTAHYLKAKTQFSPYPVRFTVNDAIDKEVARQELGLENNYTVLIVGGSQGSRSLNNVFIKFAQKSPLAKEIQILHQAGLDSQEAVLDAYKAADINAQVFGFYDKMNLLYCAADIIICRAGAGAVAESLFFNRPTVFVPLETTTTHHQLENAQAATAEYPQLFSWLHEKDLTVESIAKLVAAAQRHSADDQQKQAHR